MSPASPAVVLARATTLAATATALAAGAHVAGGGHDAHGLLLAAMAVLQLALAVPLSRRPLTTLRVAAWAAGTQAADHVLLAWLHPTAGTEVSVAAHHGSEHAAAVAAGPLGHAGAAMLAVHALAAVAVVLLVAGADRAAGAVRARWQVVVRAIAPVEAQPRRLAQRAQTLVHGAPAVLLGHDQARRGPPALVLA